MALPPHEADPPASADPAEIPAAGGEAAARPISAGPPVPRFCRGCGAVWQPEWIACPACAARAQARNAVRAAPAGGAARPVVSSLALYFTLLLSTIVFALLGGNDVSTEFAIEALDIVVVLIWAAASWRLIAPGLRTLSQPRWYLTAVGCAIPTFMVATAAVWGLHQAFGIEMIRAAEPILNAGYGWGMVVLVICVQPAVIEELAFRGVILSGMQRVLHDWEAILVSALLFMVIHLAVASFPHLLLIGVALGWLRVRTGSLYPGMALHFTHNFLCVFFEQWGW